jgi:hypothetical protein
MSFSLTTVQIRNRTKTVTRRIGWTFLKPGDRLQPIEKGQGLRKGETVRTLGGPIEVVSVTREYMSEFCRRADARQEVGREGFPEMTPREFQAFFRTYIVDSRVPF